MTDPVEDIQDLDALFLELLGDDDEPSTDQDALMATNMEHMALSSPIGDGPQMVEAPADLEEWRLVTDNPKYQVSSYGNIRNTESTRQFQLRKEEGKYIRINLQGYASPTTTLHPLIAEAFLGAKPGPQYQVDHIDRDVHNNHINNLRWATRSENCLNRAPYQNKGTSRAVDQYTLGGEFVQTWESVAAAVRGTGVNETTIHHCLNGKVKSPTQHSWRYHVDDDLPDEEWRTVKYNVQTRSVSNLGRVDVGGTKSYGALRADGYRYFAAVGAHLMVATAFHANPNDYKMVNHKDGNKQNNHVDNLEWTTPQMNSQHAADMGLNKLLKPVQQIDVTTGAVVATYPSVSLAAKTSGASPSNIATVCRTGPGRLKAKGYSWRYVSDAPQDV